ncbi:MAG: histidinol-phosphatase HisJ family protein [Clostridiaceae bacterium]
MYVDMHSHLRGWSPDGAQSAEELLEAAAEMRLAGVAITDHYDIDSATDFSQIWIFDPNQYYSENLQYRKKPSDRKPTDRPGLLIGIEIGYLPNHIDELRQLAASRMFDCVILSLHEYEGINPVYFPGDLFNDEISAVYARVIEVLAESAEMIPQADIIGHYDFFSRYAPQEKPKMLYRHAPEAFDRLFRVMVQNRQALEINTRTVEALHEERGYDLRDAMPDPAILSRYRELGGTLFTLGSDAHRKEDVARYFSQTAEWLKEQGVQSLHWMEERRWCTAPLE